MKTRKEIKAAAIELVKKIGLINLTGAKLCQKIGIPKGSLFVALGGPFSELVEELKVEGHVGPMTGGSTRVNDRDLRREQILRAAIRVAATEGIDGLTRDKVGKAANISAALVSEYFGTMKQFKRAVKRAIIDRGDIPAAARNLAELARELPAEVKQEAMQYINEL